MADAGIFWRRPAGFWLGRGTGNSWMNDLFVALALVLVIEGLVWALAPRACVKMLEAAVRTPERTLSFYGWIAVGVGAVIVWLIRG